MPQARPFEPLNLNAETVTAMKAAGRGELVKAGKPDKLLEAECGRLYIPSALMTLAQHTDAASAPVQSWLSFPRARVTKVRLHQIQTDPLPFPESVWQILAFGIR